MQIVPLAIHFVLVWSMSAMPSIQTAPLTETKFRFGEEEFEITTEVPDSSLSTIPPIDINQVDNVPAPQPSSTGTGASIISQYQLTELNGDYAFGFKTSNGIEVEEKGTQKDIIGPDGEISRGTSSAGSYSYSVIDIDGQSKKVTVSWTADERGFWPIVTITPN